MTGEQDCNSKVLQAQGFLAEVERSIVSWVGSEAETKRGLQQEAIQAGWTAQLLAERLRQATLSPDTLAKHLDLSEHVLREKLAKAGAKFTVGEMIQQARLQLAAEMLTTRLASTSIIDIAQACGWDDPRRFAVCFKALWGVSPKEFQVKRKVAVSSNG